MPVSPNEFREALSHFASGVTVVTTRNATGQSLGLTASAFTSVSLEPPWVLVCVDRDSDSHDALIHTGWFAINILARDQEALSRHFATAEGDKFAGISHRTGLHDLPVFENALTVLECRLIHTYNGGDHTICVGEVETAHVQSGEPLLYYRHRYHSL